MSRNHEPTIAQFLSARTELPVISIKWGFRSIPYPERADFIHHLGQGLPARQ
jgi:hypothetical protein